MSTVLRYFKEEKEIVFNKLDLLQTSIQNLQYEGKVSFQKNIRNIGDSVESLKKIFLKHTALDDEIIFPFARKHIPRLDAMISFLNAERNELKSQLETFEILFHHLVDKKGKLEHYKISEQLKDKGIYVVCIMRNHIQAEREGVYNVLDKELNILEKKKLYTLLKKNIKSYQKQMKELINNQT